MDVWVSSKCPMKIITNITLRLCSQEMDDALIDAFLHQQNDGNRVGGTFISKAYDTIIKELGEKFGCPFGKEKVKSRWKLVKKRFGKYYDLFNNGLSGFAWEPTTKEWCAEPEVWRKLIEVYYELFSFLSLSCFSLIMFIQ